MHIDGVGDDLSFAMPVGGITGHSADARRSLCHARPESLPPVSGAARHADTLMPPKCIAMEASPPTAIVCIS